MSGVSSVRAAGAAVAVAALLALPRIAVAQESVESFYKGKTITALIAGTPGGLFDIVTRTMAEFYGKQLPGNPRVQAQNMPGGGGLVLANHLYNVAPKDGTVIAYVGPIAIDPLLNPETGRAKFEALKFTWIGSLGTQHSVLSLWSAAPAKTVDDLFKIETVVAGTGSAATTDIYPKVLNAVLGTKFKLVTGYQGSQETYLAMERGEAHGRFNSWDALKSTVPQWLEQKKLNIVLQAALTRHAELPDVPTVLEIAKTDEQKQAMRFLFLPAQSGRPIAAPPDVPADRVKALRDGFAKLVKDEAFLAEMRKRGVEVEQPMTGEELAKNYAVVYATPQPIIDRVAAAMK
jgi:tripartite-type tricarboxylate transporter receptor subunit TctC